MQNEHSISFYHPKACRHETAEPFTSPSSDRTPTHAHTHTTGSKYKPQKLGSLLGLLPLIYYFLSFIYIKNVYSRREGHFGGVLSVW